MGHTRSHLRHYLHYRHCLHQYQYYHTRLLIPFTTYHYTRCQYAIVNIDVITECVRACVRVWCVCAVVRQCDGHMSSHIELHYWPFTYIISYGHTLLLMPHDIVTHVTTMAPLRMLIIDDMPH